MVAQGMRSITTTILLIISFGIYAEDGAIVAFILKDESAKKIVAISPIGKIEYVAIEPIGDHAGVITKGSITKGSNISKIHVIINNNSGRITINFIACLFGESFAVWGDGHPIGMERIKEGVIEDVKSGAFFARFSVKDIGELPNTCSELSLFGLTDVKNLLAAKGAVALPSDKKDTPLP